MMWKSGLPARSAAASLAWEKRFLRRFDISALEFVSIDRGDRRYEGVYGQCVYPTRRRPTYRICCHAPGPFPCTTVTRKKPLYRRPDGTFPRAPRGCRRGLLCCAPDSSRVWYRVLGKTGLASLDEAVVWIVSHEAFHFLRHSRQVPGRDTEIDADQFADEKLDQFRAEQRPWVEVEAAQLVFPWAVGGR